MRSRYALALVVVLAAGLRFTGLSAGLRHRPSWDERAFVDAAGLMVASGDLDHRFQEYPALFVYLLTPAVALFHSPASGYLAARMVVAAFGVLSVVLVYRLGAWLEGPWTGLSAALVVAVSPLEVATAHTVRPDVVLETFVLGAFLVFQREDARSARSALSGVTLGAAAAIKPTAILLFPSYVATRLLGAGSRRGLLIAIGVASLSFVIASPYSVLHGAAFLDGLRAQWGYHYTAAPVWATFWRGITAYLSVVAHGLGLGAALLMVLGIVVAAPQRRRWLPLVLFPILLVAVLSTAQVRRPRFIVPAVGVLALLAGRSIAEVAARHEALGALVLLLVTAPPLSRSLRYDIGASHSSPRDLALAWIDEHRPPGSRVFTSVPALGIDRSRYEVVPFRRRLAPRVQAALSGDLVAVDPLDRELLRHLLVVFWRDRYEPIHEGGIVLGVAPPGLRQAYERITPRREWLSASEGEPLLANAVDGDLSTHWRTAGPQKAGSWIAVRFPRPRTVGGIEIALGDWPEQHARDLTVYLSPDGVSWEKRPFQPGRPAVQNQIGLRSQVAILEPARVVGVKLVQARDRGRPWSVAELTVDAVAERGASPRR
jgi:hypothetical protein